jgi:ribose/xylose/arabinose/galactoside ABC-type transport system permease subunit
VIASGILKTIIGFFRKHMLIVVYIVLAIFMLIFTDGFFNTFNIAAILGLGSIMGFLVLGEALVILTGGIDLSVGRIASFSGVIAAWTMLKFHEILPTSAVIFLVIVFGILSGAFIGFINGISVAKLGIPPLIATLGGMGIAYGLAEYVFAGIPTNLEVKAFSSAVRLKVLNIFPLSSVIFIIFAIILSIYLWKVKSGRYIYAVGGSQEAAFLSGVKTDKVLIWTYVMSGVLSAVGGLLLAGWMRVGDARAGGGYEFIAITAVVMAGFSLFGGVGNIWDAVIGIMTLQTIRKIIPHLMISTFFEDGIVGGILLIAVMISVLSIKRMHTTRSS